MSPSEFYITLVGEVAFITLHADTWFVRSIPVNVRFYCFHIQKKLKSLYSCLDSSFLLFA